MARALRASGLDEIQGPDGTLHDWRDELITTLVDLQRADGSWKNDEDRWEESRPELATIYAVLAIEEALKPTLDAATVDPPPSEPACAERLLPQLHQRPPYGSSFACARGAMAGRKVCR